MKRIYLDLNHWIFLAQAHYAKNNNKYRDTYDKIVQSVEKGDAIYPISSTHIIEASKNYNTQRRRRLAEVMWNISKGWTIAPGAYLVRKQIKTCIRNRYSKDMLIEKHEVHSAFGRSIVFAFGMEEKMSKYFHDSEEIAARFLDMLRMPESGRSYFINMLVGDNPELMNRLIQDARDIANRTEQSREVSKNESKYIRKKIYCVIATKDAQDDIAFCLKEYGVSIETFMEQGENKLISFLESVPTLNIDINLSTERSNHWDRQIDPNDMYDLENMSISIPYCDIVLNEPFWIELAKRKKYDIQYNTVLLSSLDQLKDYL